MSDGDGDIVAPRSWQTVLKTWDNFPSIPAALGVYDMNLIESATPIGDNVFTDDREPYISVNQATPSWALFGL
jgi:hypothetical protein